MILKYLICSLLFCSAIHTFGQQQEYSGVVISSENDEPIPFCNIRLSDSNFGVVSNMDGTFTIEYPDRDSLKITISHVAFETKSLFIKRNESSKRIELTPSVFLLDDLVITDKGKCDQLLEAAFQRLDRNYSPFPLTLKYHYIELLKFDSLFGRFVEICGNLIESRFDHKRKRNKKNNYTATIEEVRCSMNLKPEFKLWNGLIHLTDQNYIRYSASFLREGLNEDYEYKYNGLEYYKGHSVHKISFIPKPEIRKPRPSGFIYITENDLAIMALETSISDKSKYFPPTQNGDTLVQMTKMKTYVDYQKVNDFWILNTINKTEDFEVTNMAGDSLYSVTVNLSMFINGYKKYENPEGLIITSNDNIYKVNYVYHPEFWKDPLLIKQAEFYKNQMDGDPEDTGMDLEFQFRNSAKVE